MSVDELRAFKLAEIPLDELQGASVAYGPGAGLFDINAALDAGDGVITTNDPILIGTLASLEYLAPAALVEGATPCELPVQSEVAASQPVSFIPQEPFEAADAVHDVEAADVVDPPVEEPPVVELVPDITNDTTPPDPSWKR